MKLEKVGGDCLQKIKRWSITPTFSLLLIVAMIISSLEIGSVKIQAKTLEDVLLDGEAYFLWAGEISGDCSAVVGESATGVAPFFYTHSTLVSYSSYDYGVSFINPYNNIFSTDYTSEGVYSMGKIIVDMENPTIVLTTKNGGDAYSYDWEAPTIFPDGVPVDISCIRDSYISDYWGTYLGFFCSDDTITQIILYDAKNGGVVTGPAISHAPSPTSTPLPTHDASDVGEWRGELHSYPTLPPDAEEIYTMRTDYQNLDEFTGRNWELWGGNTTQWSAVNLKAKMDLSAYESPVVKVSAAADGEWQEAIKIEIRDFENETAKMNQYDAVDGDFDVVCPIDTESGKIELMVAPHGEGVTITKIMVYDLALAEPEETETPVSTPEPSNTPSMNVVTSSPELTPKPSNKSNANIVTHSPEPIQSPSAITRDVIQATEPSTQSFTVQEGEKESLKIQLNARKNGNIIIQWNSSIKADRYEIYRSEKKTKGYQKIKRLSGTKSSFVDKTVLAGRKYFYQIKAVFKKETGEEKISSEVSKILVPLKKAPAIVVSKKKTAQDTKYIEVKVKKCHGTQIEIQYKKGKGRFHELYLRYNRIKKTKGKFQIQYLTEGEYLSIRARTYSGKKKQKEYSQWSKVIKLKT